MIDIVNKIKNLRNNRKIGSGYIFAPYITMESTSVITEGSFNPSLRVSSRYSKKIVNASFYGIFTLHNDTREYKIRKIIEKI